MNDTESATDIFRDLRTENDQQRVEIERLRGQVNLADYQRLLDDRRVLLAMLKTVCTAFDTDDGMNDGDLPLAIDKARAAIKLAERE